MDAIVANLKPIFDSCDKNGDGFVKTQDLIQFSGLGGQEHSKEVDNPLMCHLIFCFNCRQFVLQGFRCVLGSNEWSNVVNKREIPKALNRRFALIFFSVAINTVIHNYPTRPSVIYGSFMRKYQHS